MLRLVLSTRQRFLTGHLSLTLHLCCVPSTLSLVFAGAIVVAGHEPIISKQRGAFRRDTFECKFTTVTSRASTDHFSASDSIRVRYDSSLLLAREPRGMDRPPDTNEQHVSLFCFHQEKRAPSLAYRSTGLPSPTSFKPEGMTPSHYTSTSTEEQDHVPAPNGLGISGGAPRDRDGV